MGSLPPRNHRSTRTSPPPRSLCSSTLLQLALSAPTHVFTLLSANQVSAMQVCVLNNHTNRVIWNYEEEHHSITLYQLIDAALLSFIYYLGPGSVEVFGDSAQFILDGYQYEH